MTNYVILKENTARNDDDHEMGEFSTVAEAETAMAELIAEDVENQYRFAVAIRVDSTK